jgi:transitional endoplasmic reticulum ATPase
MGKSSAANKEITLKVGESVGKDVGHGIARIDPADMKRLGIGVGDIIEVAGQRKTICKVLPTFKGNRSHPM